MNYLDAVKAVFECIPSDKRSKFITWHTLFSVNTAWENDIPDRLVEATNILRGAILPNWEQLKDSLALSSQTFFERISELAPSITHPLSFPEEVEMLTTYVTNLFKRQGVTRDLSFSSPSTKTTYTQSMIAHGPTGPVDVPGKERRGKKSYAAHFDDVFQQGVSQRETGSVSCSISRQTVDGYDTLKSEQQLEDFVLDLKIYRASDIEKMDVKDWWTVASDKIKITYTKQDRLRILLDQVKERSVTLLQDQEYTAMSSKKSKKSF